MTPPTVGRMVHVQLADVQHKPMAAIITKVGVGLRVHLTLFWPDVHPGLLADIPFSETPRDNHWSWPPRV